MSNPAVSEDLNKAGAALIFGLSAAQLPGLFAMELTDPISYLFRLMAFSGFGASAYFLRSALIEATGRDVLGMVFHAVINCLGWMFGFIGWLLFSRRPGEGG